MKKLSLCVLCFLKEEEGVTAIEYALLGALIAVMIISGATLIGTNLDAIFTSVAGQIPAMP